MIDPKSIAVIPSISGRHNGSNETLLINKHSLLSIHEVNEGSKRSPSSAAQINRKSRKTKTVSFPAIAHRITDATSVDQHAKFWAMNYGFGADPHLANPEDELLAGYGVGASHQLENNVERLLEFKITEKGVELSGRPPLPLKLTQENGRNWEGIVRYKLGENLNGLLLVTDKYPKTYFGFVPFPK